MYQNEYYEPKNCLAVLLSLSIFSLYLSIFFPKTRTIFQYSVPLIPPFLQSSILVTASYSVHSISAAASSQGTPKAAVSTNNFIFLLTITTSASKRHCQLV